MHLHLSNKPNNNVVITHNIHLILKFYICYVWHGWTVQCLLFACCCQMLLPNVALCQHHRWLWLKYAWSFFCSMFVCGLWNLVKGRFMSKWCTHHLFGLEFLCLPLFFCYQSTMLRYLHYIVPDVSKIQLLDITKQQFSGLFKEWPLLSSHVFS